MNAGVWTLQSPDSLSIISVENRHQKSHSKLRLPSLVFKADCFSSNTTVKPHWLIILHEIMEDKLIIKSKGFIIFSIII